MRTPKHSRKRNLRAAHRSRPTLEWHEQSLIMRYLAALTGSRPRPRPRVDPRPSHVRS